MNTTMNTTNEPDDIETLLPWHAAGTLQPRDAQRVEDALARDPELAKRYALVREELGETIRLNESLGAPSTRAMEALFKKIDAEPARRPRVSLNLRDAASEFFASLSPRTLAWSATGAAIAILLQAGLAGRARAEQRGGTWQLSDRFGARCRVTDGTFVMVRFAAAGEFRRHDGVSASQQPDDGWRAAAWRSSIGCAFRRVGCRKSNWPSA